TRYTLELLGSLEPALERSAAADRDAVESVRAELAETEAATQPEWARAFMLGEPDGVGVDVPLWDAQPISEADLPGTDAVGAHETLYGAIDAERANGEICCSPVAYWDEDDRMWRPTVIVGAS